MDLLWSWWAHAAPHEEHDASTSEEIQSPESTQYYDVESPSESQAAPVTNAATLLTAPAAVDCKKELPALAIQWCGFVETYGRLAGPALVVGVVVALLWTLLLITINAAPTWMINTLFRTSTIDDGDLWLLVSPTTTTTGCVVAALVVVALYYLYLLFLLAWRRKNALIIDDHDDTTSSCLTFICEVVKNCVGALDNEARPYLKVSEELPEIAYQTLLLHVFLVKGMGAALVVIFSAVIAINCFLRCYRVLACERYHERNDSLANALFQFFFAVLFPLIQLLCAADAFSIDREGYAIRLLAFDVGAFERLARFAQPDQYTTTRVVAKTLVELQLLGSNALLAVAACGLHLAFLWRVHDIVLGSLLGYKKRRIPMSALMSDDDSCFDIVRGLRSLYSFCFKIVMAPLCLSTKFLSRCFAVVLFTYGVGILVATVASIVFSREACAPFKPQCALNAHEFHGLNAHAYASCGCIVYVSQPNRTVATWSEWSTRANAASDLTALAQAKRLESVQLVDQDLVELPHAVAQCEQLRELVLVRTRLRSLPTWLVDMDELQLLHIAGDDNTTLSTFPLGNEFFAQMQRLRVLRLEDITAFTSFPTIPHGSLALLRSLTLANLPKIRNLPAMNHLDSLQTLLLMKMKSLERLPLLAQEMLRSLHVEMPTALCCNGYLDGAGDTCSDTNATSSLSEQCAIAYAGANDTIACLTSDTMSTTQTRTTQQWLSESSFQCAYRNAGAS